MTHPRTSRSRRRAPLALLGLALAGALIAGCGSSKPSGASAASEQSRERQEETRTAEFARCMREHGIEAQTAHGPNGGFGLKVTGKAGTGPQQMEAAQRACKQFQPREQNVNLSPQQKVEREEAVLKFAACMRAHGIDIHASAAGGDVRIQVGPGSGGGPNPESPTFQAAQKACQGLLPLRKNTTGGGPGQGTQSAGFGAGG